MCRADGVVGLVSVVALAGVYASQVGGASDECGDAGAMLLRGGGVD